MLHPDIGRGISWLSFALYQATAKWWMPSYLGRCIETLNTCIVAFMLTELLSKSNFLEARQTACHERRMRIEVGPSLGRVHSQQILTCRYMALCGTGCTRRSKIGSS